MTRWRREVVLDRKRHEVVLTEDYALGEARVPNRLHFVTPRVPDISTAGRVVLPSPTDTPTSPGMTGGHVLLYDAKRFTANVEEKPIQDSRLTPLWGDRLYRIVLTARNTERQGSHRIVVRAIH